MKPALTLTVALALVLVPASAQAQRISGPAVAVDGDTLDMTGFRVRLFGIDAVEAGIPCLRPQAPGAAHPGGLAFLA